MMQEVLRLTRGLGPILASVRDELVSKYARNPCSAAAMRDDEAQAWELVNAIRVVVEPEVIKLEMVLRARQSALAAMEEGGGRDVQ